MYDMKSQPRKKEECPLELNRQTVKKILGIVAFGVLLYLGVKNITVVWGVAKSLFGYVTPFAVGACIAFILNVPTSFLERNLFRRWQKNGKSDSRLIQTVSRLVSIILALVLVVAVIFVVLFTVIPELIRSGQMIAAQVPTFIKSVQEWFAQNEDLMPQVATALEMLSLDWIKLQQQLLNLLQNGATMLAGSVWDTLMNLFNGFFNFFIGLIFAFYILFQKEKLGQQAKQVFYAFLPEEKGDLAVRIASLSYRTFAKFLSGQCVEAVILGLMFVISMSIFGFPYAMMTGMLIALLALIPIFGALIGCVIGTFFILISDGFITAFWFVILFLILQQIEGNLIYPKVVGNSVGLPSIWVLVAVTIGGSAMGILGMLIFIPLCSVLYALFRELVYARLKRKNVGSAKTQPSEPDPPKPFPKLQKPRLPKKRGKSS